MIDKMLFIEVKPNIVVSFGVERNRQLEKRLKKIKSKKKINK